MQPGSVTPERENSVIKRFIHMGAALVAVLIAATIGLYCFFEYLKVGRESVVEAQLRSFHDAEMQFHNTHGTFGTLKNLADAGLIEGAMWHNGSPYGYNSAASVNTYCIQATRDSASGAHRDFIITETGVILSATSTIPRPFPCHPENQNRLSYPPNGPP